MTLRYPDRVTYPALGLYGRLGNAMFQVAATAHHAKRLGLEPLFPPWPYAEALNLPPHWFSTEPVIGELYSELEDPDEWQLNDGVYRAGWNYRHIPKEARELHGYFQSPKWFGFDRSIFPKPNSLNFTTVHVRRGDFLDVPRFHPTLSPEYYSNALSILNTGEASKLPLVVATDDRRYSHSLFQNVLISNGDELFDLELIAGSRFIIMANSSFSWWGAFLSNAEKVICPRQWFGPALPNHKAEQLFLPEWTVI